MAGSPSGPVPTRASRSYSLPSMPTPTQCTQYLLPNPIVFRIGLHHKLNRFLRGYLNISFHNQSHLNSIALRMRLKPSHVFMQEHLPQPTSSQSRAYIIPNVPPPIHIGAPQPSQMSDSFPGHPYIRPTPSYPTSQMIKPSSFVANDPFQVPYGSAVIDSPSNFDEKLDSYAQPPLDDCPYYHRYYLDRPASYPRSRYNPSQYDDFNDNRYHMLQHEIHIRLHRLLNMLQHMLHLSLFRYLGRLIVHALLNPTMPRPSTRS